MGIRETLNQNPAITTGGTIAIIVIALIVIAMQIFGGRPSIPTKDFFTTDDSSPEAALAAIFTDKIDQIPPFDHNGKMAYRAHVFTCDHGKTRFIAYLDRYTDAAKAKLAELKAMPNSGSPAMVDQAVMNQMEVKKPGPSPWVNQMSPTAMTQGQEIMKPVCPNGGTEDIEPVSP